MMTIFVGHRVGPFLRVVGESGWCVGIALDGKHVKHRQIGRCKASRSSREREEKWCSMPDQLLPQSRQRL